MAAVTGNGQPMNTAGTLPAVGSKAPDFELVASDLSIKRLSDYQGKKVLMNVFLSIDTGTCAQSTRTFNTEAAELDNTVVLCISRDLPFALSRFCGAEGLDNVETLSDFRDHNFGKNYELELVDGPLTGLLSRCVIVIDENGVVKYTEQVQEVSEEPNYKAPLYALLNE